MRRIPSARDAMCHFDNVWLLEHSVTYFMWCVVSAVLRWRGGGTITIIKRAVRGTVDQQEPV